MNLFQNNFLPQLSSLMGAFIVLTAYIGHQLKWERFDADKYLYNICNSVASILLIYAALFPVQYGFLIMEGAWGLTSVYSILRIYKKKKI